MPKIGLGFGLDRARVRGLSTAPVVNPNFDNLTGLQDLGGGWYGGVPFGWNSEVASTGYSLRSTDGVFYANLQVLSDPGNGFKTFYQDLGALQSSATATLSLKAGVLAAGSSELFYGFYNSTTQDLIAFNSTIITAPTSSPQTVSFGGEGVAGTPIRLSFWSSNPVGIRDVSITLG